MSGGKMMKYPEIMLIPFLMFADYLLTVFAAVQKEKKHSRHFKTPYYELNPLWQKSIAEKKWFNPRHTLLVILASALLVYLAEFSALPVSFLQGVVGALFVIYGMILGRHLANILVFRYMAKNESDISGQVAMSHAMVLSISTYQYLVIVIPFAAIAMLAPTSYVIGGFLGAVMVLVIHFLWV